MVDRPAAALVLTAVATLAAAVSARPQTHTLAITRVTVVDVVDGRVIPNSTVSISGRTIATVTPGGAPPAGARVVDGRGTFLIFGLWDTHAHMEASGESATATLNPARYFGLQQTRGTVAPGRMADLAQVKAEAKR